MSRPPAVVFDTEVSGTQVHNFYWPGLDILRALAFLLVFVAHGLLLEVNHSTQAVAVSRAGEFGVSIFFFLSSYLITELLLRENRDTGTIDIKAFYVRRSSFCLSSCDAYCCPHIPRI